MPGFPEVVSDLTLGTRGCMLFSRGVVEGVLAMLLRENCDFCYLT